MFLFLNLLTNASPTPIYSTAEINSHSKSQGIVPERHKNRKSRYFIETLAKLKLKLKAEWFSNFLLQWNFWERIISGLWCVLHTHVHTQCTHAQCTHTHTQSRPPYPTSLLQNVFSMLKCFAKGSFLLGVHCIKMIPYGPRAFKKVRETFERAKLA